MKKGPEARQGELLKRKVTIIDTAHGQRARIKGAALRPAVACFAERQGGMCKRLRRVLIRTST